jgi:hypothetical protein
MKAVNKVSEQPAASIFCLNDGGSLIISFHLICDRFWNEKNTVYVYYLQSQLSVSRSSRKLKQYWINP